ncbi:MAG: metalloregulator ArsR/SmtB family transcription factor [Nakamurella sp.]
MDELSETLRALSDPSRRRQLERLTHGSATSGQLAELLTMSRPAGSQHLAVLAGSGLVDSAAVGRQRWHTLQPDRLYTARAWLDRLLTQWEATAAATGSAPAGQGPDRAPASVIVMSDSS